ncbi:MAG: hypothetical protein U0K35_00285, partial [Prevotella sp.]|nr:hypothetical protein [Prevotella sp.]
EVTGRYAAFGVEDRGRYFGKLVFCIKTNVFYLLLSPSPSTSLYLQGKRNLRNLNNIKSKKEAIHDKYISHRVVL